MSFSNCFAGGLFLAIGILHILPEAAEALSSKDELKTLKGEDESYPWAYLICIMSFSFILLIDKVIFNTADQIPDREHIDLSHSFLKSNK